jgi:ATP-binding cassette subfamily B multidrug efflux pump
MFTGTLKSNIRLGSTNISDDSVRAAAEQVNLIDFIDDLPEGFNTSIRERGAGLSTGQKQLVSFARALAHNPRILILDEATSSVDTETEFRVRDALNSLLLHRTSVIIAHRLSTIQRANRILVMHKAQLREVGTHQELLALRGIYWKLYQLQYKEEELESREELTPRT